MNNNGSPGVCTPDLVVSHKASLHTVALLGASEYGLLIDKLKKLQINGVCKGMYIWRKR